MVIPDIDWAGLADEEIGAIYNAAIAERDRRMIPAQMDTLQQQRLELAGATQGEEWVAPTHAEDSYPKGWKVKHGGKEWESLTPFNTWEPGQDINRKLWREVVPPAPEAPETPAGPEPWGVNMAIPVGKVVSYEGVLYEATQAHTTQAGWEPPVVPALWRRSNTVPARTTPATTPKRN